MRAQVGGVIPEMGGGHEALTVPRTWTCFPLKPTAGLNGPPRRSAGVLFAEPVAELKTHEEDSGEEEDDGGVVRVVVEVPGVEEDETDDEVQEAPEGIDDGRG